MREIKTNWKEVWFNFFFLLEPGYFIQSDDTEVGEVEDIRRVTAVANLGTTNSYFSQGYNEMRSGEEMRSPKRLSRKQNITDLKTAMTAMNDLLGQLTESHKTPPNMTKESWNKQLNSELKNLVTEAQDLIGSATKTGTVSRAQLDEMAKKMAFTMDAVAIAARNAG